MIDLIEGIDAYIYECTECDAEFAVERCREQQEEADMFCPLCGRADCTEIVGHIFGSSNRPLQVIRFDAEEASGGVCKCGRSLLTSDDRFMNICSECRERESGKRDPMSYDSHFA